MPCPQTFIRAEIDKIINRGKADRRNVINSWGAVFLNAMISFYDTGNDETLYGAVLIITKMYEELSIINRRVANELLELKRRCQD